MLSLHKTVLANMQLHQMRGYNHALLCNGYILQICLILTIAGVPGKVLKLTLRGNNFPQ